MKVLAIEKSRRGGKFYILLEGNVKIEVSGDVLVDFGLRRGDDVSSDTLSRIRNAQSYHDAFAAGVRLLNFRQRTRAELYRRLGEKGFDKTVIDKVIDRMLQLGLVNDEEYARAFVNSGATVKLLGKRSLFHKLWEKGIDREIAEKAMREVSSDENQVAIAIAAAKRKLERLSDERDEKKKEKLSAFLVSRGFEWEVVRKVVNKLLSGEVNDESL